MLTAKNSKGRNSRNSFYKLLRAGTKKNSALNAKELPNRKQFTGTLASVCGKIKCLKYKQSNTVVKYYFQAHGQLFLTPYSKLSLNQATSN